MPALRLYKNFSEITNTPSVLLITLLPDVDADLQSPMPLEWNNEGGFLSNYGPADRSGSDLGCLYYMDPHVRCPYNDV